MPEQKLYIGNLSYRAKESDVREYFRDYGPIYSVVLIYDCYTRYTRGYGFIELEASAAEAAMRELNNTMFMGRTLKIREAAIKDAPTIDKNEPPAAKCGKCVGCKGEKLDFCFGEYREFKREYFNSLHTNGEYYYIRSNSCGLYHTYKFNENRMEYSGPSNKSPL